MATKSIRRGGENPFQHVRHNVDDVVKRPGGNTPMRGAQTMHREGTTSFHGTEDPFQEDYSQRDRESNKARETRHHDERSSFRGREEPFQHVRHNVDEVVKPASNAQMRGAPSLHREGTTSFRGTEDPFQNDYTQPDRESNRAREYTRETRQPYGDYRQVGGGNEQRQENVHDVFQRTLTEIESHPEGLKGMLRHVQKDKSDDHRPPSDSHREGYTQKKYHGTEEGEEEDIHDIFQRSLSQIEEHPEGMKGMLRHVQDDRESAEERGGEMYSSREGKHGRDGYGGGGESRGGWDTNDGIVFYEKKSPYEKKEGAEYKGLAIAKFQPPGDAWMDGKAGTVPVRNLVLETTDERHRVEAPARAGFCVDELCSCSKHQCVPSYKPSKFEGVSVYGSEYIKKEIPMYQGAGGAREGGGAPGVQFGPDGVPIGVDPKAWAAYVEKHGIPDSRNIPASLFHQPAPERRDFATESRAQFTPKEILTKPLPQQPEVRKPLKFDGTTTYRSTYISKDLPAHQQILPPPPHTSLRFEGMSQYQSDFKKHPLAPRTGYPGEDWRGGEGVGGKGGFYDPSKGGRGGEGYGGVGEGRAGGAIPSARPPLRFEGNTQYQTDYKRHDIEKKETPLAPEYKPSKEGRDFSTQYRAAYLPHRVVVCPVNRLPAYPTPVWPKQHTFWDPVARQWY